MENRRVLTGILAIILVFGLVFAGCEHATDDEEEKQMGKRIIIGRIFFEVRK